jgi:hypothetical protein
MSLVYAFDKSSSPKKQVAQKLMNEAIRSAAKLADQANLGVRISNPFAA